MKPLILGKGESSTFDLTNLKSALRPTFLRLRVTTLLPLVIKRKVVPCVHIQNQIYFPTALLGILIKLK